MFLDQELMELDAAILWRERSPLHSAKFLRRLRPNLRRRIRRYGCDSFARVV